MDILNNFMKKLEEKNKLIKLILHCNKVKENYLEFGEKIFARENEFILPVWTCYGNRPETQEIIQETYIISNDNVIFYSTNIDSSNPIEFQEWRIGLKKYCRKLVYEYQDKEKKEKEKAEFNTMADALANAKKGKHRKNRKKKHEKR